MNVVSLSWRYVWSRPVSAVLNVLMLGLGLGALALILLAQQRVVQALERDVAGVDVVVGAKGSPLQLILAGIYHADVPPGNVALADVEALRRHPQVAQLIPLSLGDNLGGFRMVGTTRDYPALYGASLAHGAWWQAPMQVVLGAQVAQTMGLRLGDHVLGVHGLGAGGHAHGDLPYTVVGILQGQGGVMDRLVLTGTESVWAVHETHLATDADADSDLAALQAEREVTLALIRYNTPLAAITFPRYVNTSTAMQAAAPAYELSRLLHLVGMGADVLRALATALLAVAGVSVFMGLWQAVRERRADLALLRLLGAPPWRLALLLLAEALWLVTLATALGLGGAHGLLAVLALAMPPETAVWVAANGAATHWWVVPAVAVGVAVLASALPAWAAYRLDVGRLLQGADG